MHLLLPLWTILYYFYSFYRWSIWIKSTTANHATMKWHSTNIRNRWRLDRCKSLIVWSPWKQWNIWRLVSLLDACLVRVITVFVFPFFFRLWNWSNPPMVSLQKSRKNLSSTTFLSRPNSWRLLCRNSQICRLKWSSGPILASNENFNRDGSGSSSFLWPTSYQPPFNINLKLNITKWSTTGLNSYLDNGSGWWVILLSRG